ncbi:hypothetical protein LuPra_01906 [Luteitalea pratensis]|uniref:PIN domain-containing protein n=1 Tax=Luteitalea pratensis TaxID=1855912 RepID=A0A143PJD4_LUTPR|nr:hypothetical protein LuPra_01906 [Luteitalea pratensis]
MFVVDTNVLVCAAGAKADLSAVAVRRRKADRRRP